MERVLDGPACGGGHSPQLCVPRAGLGCHLEQQTALGVASPEVELHPGEPRATFRALQAPESPDPPILTQGFPQKPSLQSSNTQPCGGHKP